MNYRSLFAIKRTSRVNQSATIPNPSMSGTTPAHVTMARSGLSKEGAELATAQPMRTCVIGLINAGIQITQAKLLFNTTDKKRTGNLRALALSYSGVWSRRPDSNRRPRRYKR